jgi:hypothetical protein
MRSRTSLLIASLALFVCLVCPLVEMFDTWDHTFQTGNDTEYALVVLALCVGVVHSIARSILKPVSVGLVAQSIHSCGAHNVLAFARGFTLLLFDVTSPSSLPLRI